MSLKEDLKLYVVTDKSWLGENNFFNQIEDILTSGATFLQLREKNLSYDEFLEEAREIKKIADKYSVPLIINDNLKIAKEIGARGVHIGPKDNSIKEAREFLGNDFIIGASARTVENALIAEKAGADYLGVGAVFGTSTKKDANKIELTTLKSITDSVKIPVVAIGGVKAENILQLKGCGVDGVAVISGIFAQENVSDATKKIDNLVNQII